MSEEKLIKDREFQPCFCAIKLDETKGYLETESGRALVYRCGGKIYGVYLYDSREVTYLCSPETNYYLLPEVTPDDERGREQLDSDLTEANIDELDRYFTCAKIDSLAKVSEYHKVIRDYEQSSSEDREVTYQEALDDALEYVRGNALF